MIIRHYLEHLLKDKFWLSMIIEKNHLLYVMHKDFTSFIEVKKHSDQSIDISIPLKKSDYQYVTSFSSEMSAYEYLEDHVYDYYEE